MSDFKKNPNPKKKILSFLGDIVGELAVTGVFLLVGLLILHLLGIDLGSDEVDLEWAVFLGAAVFLLLFAAVILVLHVRKKKQEKNQKQEKLEHIEKIEDIEDRKDENSRES